MANVCLETFLDRIDMQDSAEVMRARMQRLEAEDLGADIAAALDARRDKLVIKDLGFDDDDTLGEWDEDPVDFN